MPYSAHNQQAPANLGQTTSILGILFWNKKIQDQPFPESKIQDQPFPEGEEAVHKSLYRAP